ncbi:tyrosine-type recombinase/integrase [Escherichia coli]|jgi:site-specific recombinase XerD|uniref:Tyrosine-type recombinase/integrase n=1 Tax=Escherichia coli TaxID=562 RepID=A0A6D0DB84_ECOLX|nr:MULTISPECIES: tyrosine-type recombinase/integrase [Escherichia]EEZ6410367.1 tyrosine-type recombinase/integrase [Escherichia coli O104]EFO2087567.1 integrase [Escherichia coli O54]EKF2560306.1 tyrosine-type recombinase/integrase [Escherichia coli O103]EKK9176887.1 tyrosine-type recombinase/integrase [Escherichia coli O121]ELO0485433.1 tyrosine-type recombinase/integrase [Escherichia coli O170]HDQ6543506.1 tyrosine-type recombinase/integrase [Escherichia coli O105:H7]HDQ6727995.1 tyrosine-
MTIKKLDDGRYEVDIRPAGRNGKRIRRKFDKKSEAVAFEKHTQYNHHDKEWLAKPTDKRHLSELTKVWWDLKGKHEEHGKSNLGKIEIFTRITDDPCAFQITKALISQYSMTRRGQGIKPASINRDLTCLSGMFTALIDAELFFGEHPFRGMKKLKEQKPETGYLTQEEITLLLANLDGDNKKIAILCLSTGARWGEAAKLKAENVIQNRVTFVKTKTNKPRTVPISEEVAVMIAGKGYLFPDASYPKFRRTMKDVKPDLPDGQATHALRHSFATHFMINGGSIITLQRILGHSRIEQTMVYAHFAPEYLQDAVSLNPLRGGVDSMSVHTVSTVG